MDQRAPADSRFKTGIADKVRIAHIGLGPWGNNLLRAIAANDKAELVAICDCDPSAIKAASKKYPMASPSGSAETLVQENGIDAVIIATSTEQHYTQAKAALLAGKHVFVEKPMTRCLKEAVELTEIAQQRNLRLMVGHTFLYNNIVEDVKYRIDRGDLGEILYIYGQRLNLGRLRPDSDVIWNLAPHDVSIANYLLSARPKQVSGRGIVAVNKASALAEVGFIQLDYADGRTVHFHLSLLDPKKIRQMVIVGSDKMLIYDDVDIDRHVQIFDKRIAVEFLGPSSDLANFKSRSRAGDIVIPSLRLKEPLAEEMDHFLNCVLTQTQPKTNGAHATEVIAILEAVSQSMTRDGAVITVDYPEAA